jgi:ATP-dependent helicase/nuclease subunit B
LCGGVFRIWQAYKRRMASRSLSAQSIEEAMASGVTIVTANQRAAHTLQREYTLQQQALGVAFWQPPAIYELTAWLSELWHTLLLEGKANELLLSGIQEHTIWRAIISADRAITSLHTIDDLAVTAADAWLRLHRYRCRARLASYAGSSDTRSFAGWAKAFERRCAHSGYVTYAQICGRIRDAVAEGSIELPRAIMFAGFDAITPELEELQESLRQAGVRLIEPLPPEGCEEVTLAALHDEDDEIAACAHWIHARLQDKPRQRIAVIVPALNNWRDRIERRLRSILAPQLNDLGAPATDVPYEFSLGVALAHTSLAATAINLLRWAIHPLPVETITSLLLSPHFATAHGTQDELLARAETDAFLVRRLHLLEPSLTADRLLRLASQIQPSGSLRILSAHMTAFVDVAAQPGLAMSTRSCSDWVRIFCELLDAVGFAQAGLDSTQFQARQKWEAALDGFATLDFDSSADPLNFDGALKALARIANETLFAPESRHAPVQIMGPLEAAGSTFDAVWFLHASDAEWPTRPAVNPLLPWALQREAHMPGGDTAHDAAYARRVTGRLAESAPVVVFSYAQQSESGYQRPSPALKDISFRPMDDSAIAHRPLTDVTLKLEDLIDSEPIPFPPDRILQGGAAILQAQAACGFRAFAEKRIFSTALDTSSLGLDASQRGSLVHAVLEDFWGTVSTQEALRQMSEADRRDQLGRSIEAAVQRLHLTLPGVWARAYIDTERSRLATQLSRFIDNEANNRRPFVVQHREETLQGARIGPLRIDVRVDRVDTVTLTRDDGSTYSAEVIIDYKTGKMAVDDWHGARPDAPQLPLYAVVSDTQPLAAVAYASIRAGDEMVLRGYEAENGILSKASALKTSTLKDQVEEWRARRCDCVSQRIS